MASVSPVSSLASWNALERAVDRWASIGALTLALFAIILYALL